MINKYIKTATMTAKNQTNVGIFYLLPEYLLRLIYLIPLLMLWQAFMEKGVDIGMSLSQMLTYTLMSTVLSDIIVIRSPLTHWIMDGPLLSLFQRPMSVYGHTIAQTLGSALPGLVFFSLPVLIVCPLFDISVMPASYWFLPSLLLCISLGFAFEFLFACLLVYMVNASWLVYSIRNAVFLLFSGSFIPFIVLPFRLGDILKYLPLGSLGGAPLAIFTGTAEPVSTIIIQIIWNIIMWPMTILIFNKTQERLTSHGG